MLSLRNYISAWIGKRASRSLAIASRWFNVIVLASLGSSVVILVGEHYDACSLAFSADGWRLLPLTAIVVGAVFFVKGKKPKSVFGLRHLLSFPPSALAGVLGLMIVGWFATRGHTDGTNLACLPEIRDSLPLWWAEYRTLIESIGAFILVASVTIHRAPLWRAKLREPPALKPGKLTDCERARVSAQI